MSIGRTAARTTVGSYFAAHGTQKLLGWFDGGGLDGTAAMFESVGIRPARANAALAGATETGLGVALVLGAATPLASAGLIATMVTAIRKVHWSNGPFIQQHGYEYNLVLIAALLALAEDGPGFGAIDRSRPGARGALGALAVGVAGSFLTELVGRRLAGPVPVAAAASAEPTPAGTPVDGAQAPIEEPVA